MNKFISALCLSVVACGAPQDDDFDQVQQDLAAPYSFHYGFGVNSDTGEQCSRYRHATTQKCSVLAGVGDMWQKTLTYKIEPAGFDTWEEVFEARYAITDLDDALDHWDFVSKTGASAAQVQLVASRTQDNCPGGSGSIEARAFGCAQLYGIKQLTEGDAVVGNYQSHYGCTVYLDMYQIRWATGGDRLKTLRLIRQATGLGVIECMGLGWKQEGTHHYSSRYIDLSAARMPLSGSEMCQLDWYSSTEFPGRFERYPDCP